MKRNYNLPLIFSFIIIIILFSNSSLKCEFLHDWFSTDDQSSEKEALCKVECTDAIFPRTDPKIMGRIYQMLKILDLILTSYHIPYWIDGGVLLGAVRHGGLIPWDDDGDIEVYAHDWPRIYALEAEFKRFGFEFRGTNRLWIQGLEFPFIDIVLTKKDENKVVSSWPNNWFYESELSLGQRIQCGPITLYAPNNPERYLKEYYGDDCMKYATYQSHISDFSHLEKVIIEDFTPASFVIEDPRIPLP